MSTLGNPPNGLPRGLKGLPGNPGKDEDLLHSRVTAKDAPGKFSEEHLVDVFQGIPAGGPQHFREGPPGGHSQKIHYRPHRQTPPRL